MNEIKKTATLIAIVGSPLKYNNTKLKPEELEGLPEGYIVDAERGSIRYPRILGYLFVANESMEVPTLTTYLEGVPKDFVVKAEDFKAKRKIRKGERFVITSAELFVMVAEAEKPLYFDVMSKPDVIAKTKVCREFEGATPKVAITMAENGCNAKVPYGMVIPMLDDKFELVEPEYIYFLNDNRCPTITKKYVEVHRTKTAEEVEVEQCKKLKSYLKEILGVS